MYAGLGSWVLCPHLKDSVRVPGEPNRSGARGPDPSWAQGGPLKSPGGPFKCPGQDIHHPPVGSCQPSIPLLTGLQLGPPRPPLLFLLLFLTSVLLSMRRCFWGRLEVDLRSIWAREVLFIRCVCRTESDLSDRTVISAISWQRAV